MESFRKAYGALKDSTQVGLAKVNSDYKELDIAIVKATNHVEAPPKERHVRKILCATSASRPRADVAYCIYALAKRLSKTRSWIVAVKVLIVLHRTLREGDPTFKEELVSFSTRRNILQITNFRDDSSPLAWDCSAWLKTYALFLEERLECFKVLKFDIECERVTKMTKGEPNAECRPRTIQSEELLQQLPALQQLLYRLVGCQPEGSAYSNHVIQYAVALVLKESFKIYCSINDGIINLVDLFFDMPRPDAVKALNIYKKAGKQAESLADFYEHCKGLDLARNFKLPTLRQPPPSFLATMEEYIKEAPQTGAVVHRLECYELEESPRAAEPEQHVEGEKQEVEEEETPQGGEEEPQAKEEKAELALVPTDGTADLLGLSEIHPEAAKLEETNALALSIIPLDENRPSNTLALSNFDGTSGWELALVTAPSNYTSQATETRLAGGFDKLLLDSLYEDEASRRQLQLQNEGYGTGGMAAMNNPFEYQNDPFAASNSIAPPTNMQLALLGQQQQQLQHRQMMFQQQTMMMSPQQQYLPYYPQYPQQHQMQYMNSSNPFGDPSFMGYPQNPTMSNQGNHLL